MAQDSGPDGWFEGAPSSSEQAHAAERAEDHFYISQALRRPGRDKWHIESAFELIDWEQRAGQPWLELRYDGLPGARIFVRLERTPQGISCTGLLVERDGKEVSARDLRQLQLRPLLDVALARYRDLLPGERPTARAARPGRPGYEPEHWRAVFEHYQRARAADRRRYIQRMRADYPQPERPSDATMRRWVQKARALHEEPDNE